MRYRVFQLDSDDDPNVIIFIPRLYKLYYVDKNVAKKIPKFITAPNRKPMQVDNLENQYLFNNAMLILTNRCNLACAYCYGECSPDCFKTMKEEIVYATIDYIIDCALKLNVKKVKLGFFGGEPTVVWPLMMKAVDYFRLKTQEASLKGFMGITTNGVMNENKAVWIAKNMDSVTLSLDGMKFIHDIHRSNSFDISFNSGKIIHEISPTILNIRSTVSNLSVQYIPEIVEFFSKNFPGCKQKYEPLFPMGRAQGEISSVGPPDPTVFFDKLIEAFSAAKKYKSPIGTSVLQFRNYSQSFCGVNGRSFNVAYDGRIFSCHRMIEGDKDITSKFCYGWFNEYSNELVFDNERYEDLKKLNFNNIPECCDCFAQYFCKGDCPATKAILYPDTFQYEKSYRCNEIKVFIKKVLKYILDNGYEGNKVKGY